MVDNIGRGRDRSHAMSIAARLACGT